MQKKRIWTFVLITIAIILLAILMISYDWEQVNSYEQYNTSTLSYVSGTVVSIEKEELTKDSYEDSRYFGTQKVVVEIHEGTYEDQEVSITNYLSNTLNIKVSEGQRVIVCVDQPGNAETYFTIFNYDRSGSLVVILGIFVLGMLLVGGMKGLRAVESLVFTMIMILFFLVPGIYHGMQVIPMTIIVLLIVVVCAVFLLNGLEKKTLLFAASTMTGLLIAAGFCAVCQSLLHINGYNFSEVESLLLISQSTGLEVKHLLFAGVLISSMGAVMDVGVSIVSALTEVKKANPGQSKKEVFTAGMNIGKDMIGTMSNTLILAFTGTSLTTVLLLIAFGYQPLQLLNSDYLTMEIVRGVSSTFAVIMTVPAASGISAIFIKDNIER